MPCGPNARVTAYVTFQDVAFTERSLLLQALAALGYDDIQSSASGSGTENTVALRDAYGRRATQRAAIVVPARCLPTGTGDIGFVFRDAAYVPLVPGRGAAALVTTVRGAYGRAKAGQLAEAARRRYMASVQQSTREDGTVTVRVRF